MENPSQPNKHKRGSSPQESIEEVYRTWLKRPGKKLATTDDQESPGTTASGHSSTAE